MGSRGKDLGLEGLAVLIPFWDTIPELTGLYMESMEDGLFKCDDVNCRIGLAPKS